MTALPLGSGICEGVVATLNFEDGTIRPVDGGPSVYFHARDEHRLSDVGGVLRFTVRGSVRGVVPTVGARVVYRIDDDRGRPIASPWGLVADPVPAAEPNYATDALATLIERKAANCFALRAILPRLVGNLQELDFRLFLSLTPDGEDLWRAFTAWRDSRTEGEQGFGAYVVDFFQANALPLGPRRCKLSPMERGMVWPLGFQTRQLQPDTRQLVLLHLEDPAMMERLAPSSCQGCGLTRCPHWGRFNRRPRR